jgi:hygromycin-B 7''-O-kinase
VTLDRPTDGQPHYGEHLADPVYWGPYVREVLDRHDLPAVAVEPPFPGSFPTFLVGDVVVKLFGDAFDGQRSSEIEAAVHRLLATEEKIPAPALLASGMLFDTSPTWPYLVIQRVPGTAIRDVQVSPEFGAHVAAELGTIVARLHQLTPPAPVRDRELLEQLRSDAAARLARFGLPDHLVEQVPEFLADAEPATTLVHGDITADHVFVDDHGITAIIDWGDALVADRSYELPAVFLDALRGDHGHLNAFLEAACWPRDQIARRALQGILEFQFNAITRLSSRIDLTSTESLDDLAQQLFS